VRVCEQQVSEQSVREQRTWRPPRLWRAALLLARLLVAVVARLRVSGEVPEQLRRGPLILAANHISPADPIVMTAACRSRGIAPRYLATAGLFRVRFVGAVMRHWGHLPVHRGTAEVTRVLPAAVAALASGSVLLVYPEGRIGLDAQLWPERGKTGAARLALATGATVVPVTQWGSHELVPYSAPRGLLRTLPATIRRRPVVRVHFGAPVDLSGLRDGVAGHAQRATDRIIDAIAADLRRLRGREQGAPYHVDPSRPRDDTRRRPRPGSCAADGSGQAGPRSIR
jgi:1-acyl-sn-glycerol-3-phosphate acyltransferase